MIANFRAGSESSQAFHAIISAILFTKTSYFLGVESMSQANFQSLLNYSCKFTLLSAIGITAQLVLAQAPSQAQSKPVAELIGQCRAVNKQTPLYKERNPASAALVLLKANEKVTLAENAGASGLISVSTPDKGFVLMANLKGCPGQPKPTPTPTGSCRVVVQKQGLSIRREPGAGEVVGGVGVNDKVTLADPLEMKAASDGRDWVKIVKPVEGWVSEGRTGQAFKNLGACP
jgi:hypothetical protein